MLTGKMGTRGPQNFMRPVCSALPIGFLISIVITNVSRKRAVFAFCSFWKAVNQVGKGYCECLVQQKALTGYGRFRNYENMVAHTPLRNTVRHQHGAAAVVRSECGFQTAHLGLERPTLNHHLRVSFVVTYKCPRLRGSPMRMLKDSQITSDLGSILQGEAYRASSDTRYVYVSSQLQLIAKLVQPSRKFMHWSLL